MYYMCTCVYVMYVCMYVCMYVYICSIYIYIYNMYVVCMYVCMYHVGVWVKSIHHRTIPCFEYIDAIMTMTMQHQDQHDDESIQDRRRDASS